MSVARSWREDTVKVQKQRPIPFTGAGVTGPCGNVGMLRAYVGWDGGFEFSLDGGQMHYELSSINDRDLADFGSWLVRTYGN